MPHEITQNPDYTVEIVASVDAETVESERRKVVSALRGKAHVPGFRPGKAPASAVAARYADEIKEELGEKLVALLWKQIIDEEQDLQPLTPPSFDAIDFMDDGGFRFKAGFEVRPRWQLPDLEGVSLPEIDVEPTTTEIEAELQKVCDENADWEPVDEDEEATDGLLVEADLSAHVEGTDDDPVTEENRRIELGGANVPHEINEALQGARIGETRHATVEVAKEGDETERKTVHYEIRVQALKRKNLPAVDDELAKSIGFGSLDELEERVRAVLRNQKAGERRTTWRRHLLDHLEQDLDVENLPPSTVRDAIDEDLHRMAYSMMMQGHQPDENMDWNMIRTRIEPEARRRVLDTLILEQLAEDWRVEVPEQDVGDYIAAEAKSQNIPPAEHKANLAAEHKLEKLRHAARLAATVTELIRRGGGAEDPA